MRRCLIRSESRVSSGRTATAAGRSIRCASDRWMVLRNAAHTSGRVGQEEVRAVRRAGCLQHLVNRKATAKSPAVPLRFPCLRAGFRRRALFQGKLQKSQGCGLYNFPGRQRLSFAPSLIRLAGTSGQPAAMPTGLADTREPTSGRGAKLHRKQDFAWAGCVDRLQSSQQGISAVQSQPTRSNFGPDGLGLKSGLVDAG